MKRFNESNVREESRYPKQGLRQQRSEDFLILAGDKQHIEAVCYGNGFVGRFAGRVFKLAQLEGRGHRAEPSTVTCGKNLTARHADGVAVEYFEAEIKEQL